MQPMQQNPYAPAQSEGSAPVRARGPRLAGKSGRFVNFLIDMAFLQLVAVRWVTAPVIFQILLASWERYNRLSVWFALFVEVLAVALTFATYYVVCELLFGRTLGKLITGTRVVSVSGRRPSVQQIIRRSLIRFIPFEAFSFLTHKPGGLHDWWSQTRVLQVRPAPRAAPASDSMRDSAGP